MEFANRGVKRSKRKQGNVNEPGTVRGGLQLYKLPPADTISLYEFEDFALERLKGWLSFCIIFRYSRGSWIIFVADGVLRQWSNFIQTNDI